MLNDCDDVNSEVETEYPVDGSSALEVVEFAGGASKSGRKKSRRKNKRNAVTYTTDSSKNTSLKIEDETGQPLTELLTEPSQPDQPSVPSAPESPSETPAQPEQTPQKPEPEIVRPPEIDSSKPLGDSVSTEAKLRQSEVKEKTDGTGIIYEIAEELYRREKTQSEIEALCRPPFKKVFSPDETERLDREADERTHQLLSAASKANAHELTFLPDGVYTDGEKPVSTTTAFLIQLILMLPVVNIAAAMLFSFGKKSNRNIKAYGRAFLIWTVVFMTLLLGYFGAFYFTSPENSSRIDFLRGLIG